MRYLHAVLCLFLAACSAPQPTTTYEQGAYRPVRPPAFNPTTDAPHTVGQPWHLRPQRQIEPNPKHKRLLPPTREPGLWAGDAPRADYGDLTRHPGEPIPNIQFFGVTLPLPPDARDAVDTLPIEWCAKEMTRRANDAVLGARIVMLPPEQRRCLAAHLVDACLQWTRDGTRIERLHASGHGGALPKDVDLWVRVEKMAAEAGRNFRDSACAGPGLFSPAVDQLLADFISHDERLYGKGRMEH